MSETRVVTREGPKGLWPEWLLPKRMRAPVVPVLRLSGAIGAAVPMRRGLTLSAMAGPLERAFSAKRAVAVALVVNSPGGAAAQSHLIYRRIRALAEEKKLPVLTFVEDVAASGGYMLACAGDEIIVDPSSLVGSIGVVSAGFGLEGLIHKLGIERRLHAAGKQKAMLDPFSPERPEDVQRLKAIQARIHERFAALVEERRLGKLDGDREFLFSGAVWSGDEAIERGLADRIGDLRTVLREMFGPEVRIKPIATGRGSLLARMLRREEAETELRGLIDPVELIGAAEERAIWARYGI